MLEQAFGGGGMIRTGLIRRVDDLGRIMIPKVIRGKLKKCGRETEVRG